MKTQEEVIHDHQNMPVGEMMKNSCVVAHILNHLNNNLEEEEGNPSYRKRERMRSKLALRQIGKWIKEYEEKLKV